MVDARDRQRLGDEQAGAPLWPGKSVDDLVRELHSKAKDRRGAKRVKELAAQVWGPSQSEQRRTRLVATAAFWSLALAVALAALVIVYFRRHPRIDDYEAAFTTSFLAVQAAALALVAEMRRNAAAWAFRVLVTGIVAVLGVALYRASHDVDGQHGLRVGAVMFVSAGVISLLLDAATRIRRSGPASFITWTLFAATTVAAIAAVVLWG